MTSRPAPQLLACAVLLRLHPLPLIYTPSYEFSVSFAGVAFGTATGGVTEHCYSVPYTVYIESQHLGNDQLELLLALLILKKYHPF